MSRYLREVVMIAFVAKRSSGVGTANASSVANAIATHRTDEEQKMT